MSKYLIALACFITSLCAVAWAPMDSVPPKQTVRPNDPLRSVLSEPFEVKSIDRTDAILMLARRYHLPLGIEFVDDIMFQPVTVLVPAGEPIKSALDDLAPSQNGFLVTNHQDVFVVSHRNVPTADNVLDTIVDEISVPGDSIQMANWALLVALDRQNRKATGVAPAQGYGVSVSGVQSKPISPFTATKISVRDVLDRIVGEDGNAAWIAQVRPLGLRRQAGRLDGLWTVVDYETGPVDGISQITRHAIGEAKRVQ